MEALGAVPAVRALVAQERFADALRVLDSAPETLAPVLGDVFPDDRAYAPAESLVLAKFFLIRREYPRAIKHALRAPTHLDTLPEPYRGALRFRILDQFLAERAGKAPVLEGLREFVLEMISTDAEDPSHLGFLAAAREWPSLRLLLKKALRNNTYCPSTLDFLLDSNYEELCSVLTELGDELVSSSSSSSQCPVRLSQLTDSLVQLIAEAYAYSDALDSLRSFLLKLPWDRLYSVCFFLEDSHRLSLSLESNSTTDSGSSKSVSLKGRLERSELTKASSRDQKQQQEKEQETDRQQDKSNKTAADGEFVDLNNAVNTAQTATPRATPSEILQNASMILSGDWKAEILSDFFFKNTKASFKLIEALGRARAPYILFCNAIMNARTTNDTLYRNNKGLLSGREWTRFLDYASLGLIHAGNVNAFEILREVLPSLEANSGEPAALMALGIMNARQADKETADYLAHWLESSTDSELVFGACMGLGLTLIASGDDALVEKLRPLFAVDSTVVQEAAAYALGLVFSGCGDSEVAALLRSVLRSSDFVRVRRACGLALALLGCMRGDEGEALCLPREAAAVGAISDAFERAAAVLSLGAAHVATGELSVVRRILPHINDTDEDVRRAAVIALGLIGYEDSDILASLILPLSQHYCVHVRSAAALTLGIFNSGTGDSAVCDVLEALLYDSEALVRQSACIGAGFALAQMNPTTVSNYKRILDRLGHFVSHKGEPQCVRIGASIGRALAEAAGRSAVFSLRNLSRQVEVERVAGALLFLNSWYWYPLMPCVALMLLPTPIFFFDSCLEATSHVLANDAKFYDYIVRVPETRRSRRARAREAERDTLYEAPQGLRSGDRLPYAERISYGLSSVVVFREEENSR